MNAPRRATSAQIKATGVHTDPRVQQMSETYFWCTVVLIPAFVAIVCLTALLDFDAFIESLDEDHWVNWVSFAGWFCAAGAAVFKAQRLSHLRAPVRAGLYMLAVFALYVGLEEVNWGQRITGMQSPEVIAKRVGHTELSLHYILTGLTGVPMDVLGGIILALYGFALPLLLTAKPALRKKYAAYLICLPVPALIPWFLFGGILMATHVPGMSQEIGEMIFGLGFALWAVTPPAVVAAYAPIRKQSVVAMLATICMLIIPLTREVQSEHRATRRSELLKGLSEVLANGTEAELQTLLDRYSPIDPAELRSPLPVLAAFNRRSLAMIDTLAKAGFTLDGYSHEGHTALTTAIWKNDLLMTEFLLSKGANPNVPDGKGNAPLHHAILTGNLQIVDAVLSKNPDIEDRDAAGYTPLMIAAIHNFYGAVDRLLKRKANLYEVDMTGRTVLELSVPGSESQVMLVAAVAKGAGGGEAVADPEPAALESSGAPSMVWDTRDKSVLMHLSIALRNAGELQANGVIVELYEQERLIGEMDGSPYVLPGKIERYSMTKKITVTDRAKLRVKAICETCSKALDTALDAAPAPPQ